MCASTSCSQFASEGRKETVWLLNMAYAGALIQLSIDKTKIFSVLREKWQFFCKDTQCIWKFRHNLEMGIIPFKTTPILRNCRREPPNSFISTSTLKGWMFLPRDGWKKPSILLRLWLMVLQALCYLRHLGSKTKSGKPLLMAYQGALPSQPLPSVKDIIRR